MSTTRKKATTATKKQKAAPAAKKPAAKVAAATKTKKETTKKETAPENEYNAVRQHGRNWIRKGLSKIQEVQGSLKDSEKVANNANAAERLGDGHGATYLKNL